MEDTKKRKSHKKIIVFFISLILVILISVGILWVTGAHLLSTTSRDIQVYDHDKAFIDKHEYVFIAKVNDLVKTKQYDGTGTDIPYTFYSIDQIEFIKGEKQSDESLLCFYGGRKYIFFYSLLNSNDERIQENEYYLFIANQKAKNSTNRRIGKNDFIITNNDQKILLNGYNPNLSLTEQNDNIQFIISRYQNIVNQQIGNESLNIPSFSSKEELVNYFDYITIVQIHEPFIRHSNGNGMGSEIPAVAYRFGSCHYLKGSLLEGNNKALYCYGTNFWEDEGKTFDHYVSLLNQDEVYLMFANTKEKDCQNTRIGENDFVIMDNYQLILLENYDINQTYDKQSAAIMNLIQEYQNLLAQN